MHTRFGGYYTEVTPVPIPNTEVKLCSAYDTWREAARESWSLPEQTKKNRYGLYLFFFCSDINPLDLRYTLRERYVPFTRYALRGVKDLYHIAFLFFYENI